MITAAVKVFEKWLDEICKVMWCAMIQSLAHEQAWVELDALADPERQKLDCSTSVL